MLWCPMVISMVSAAAGTAAGTNSAVPKRRMHLRVIEGCVLVTTAVAKLRLFRVPELLSGSFTLALLAVMTFFFVK